MRLHQLDMNNPSHFGLTSNRTRLLGPLGCEPSSHLKRLLEVFERNHFDPEELHAHEEGDDGLGHVRRSFPAPKFTKLGEKFLLGRQKSETKKWSIVKNALLLLQQVGNN